MRSRLILSASVAAGTLLIAACAGNSGALPNAQAPLAAMRQPFAAANAIVNGCFTSGKLAPWKIVKGKANGSASVVKGGYGTCKYAAFAGTSKPPSPDGFYGVAQIVKVTKAGKLSWYYWGSSNDSIKYGDQEVDVVEGGKIVDTCYKALTTNTDKDWKKGTCKLAKYAGKKVTLQFGVYDNGYSKTYVNWHVSDISLQ